MPTLPVRNLRLHDACSKVPQMQPDEWAVFLDDVRRRGVQEPIVVQKGGIVLDGRHRLKAANARGDEKIVARMVDLSEKEQIEFIITAALLRRHLTDDQRSILAARFQEPLSKAAKADRARKGGQSGGRGRTKEENSLSDTASDKLSSKVDTRSEAASHFQVPERKLRSAAAVEHDCPDLADRVLAGELTLPQAKQEVRRQQKREQLETKAKEACESSAKTSWEIRHGDCLEILPTVTETSRLIFADPPYNIGIDYGEGKSADRLDDVTYLAWVEKWLAACRDTLAPDGSLWVLIGDEYAAEYAVTLKRLGLTIRSWIKWREAFGVNCARNFNRCSRHLFYGVRDPKHFVFNEEAVARPSDRQAKYGDKRANPGGKLWDNVWGINPPIPRLTGTCKERLPDFPTQLPLALLEPIVLCASEPGDLVIDPFNGSGTTGVAAIRHGRRYFGVEKSEEFTRLARLRLKGVDHE